MKLNRVIAFALVLVMLFALTACGSKTAEKEEAAARCSRGGFPLWMG